MGLGLLPKLHQQVELGEDLKSEKREKFKDAKNQDPKKVREGDLTPIPKAPYRIGHKG